MPTHAIRVEGLGKRYRLAHDQEGAPYRTLRESIVNFVKAPFRKRGMIEEFWALNDVSFEVQPGEVVGIIGRNGAGKSTLLKILSRITKPTKGRVEINGRVGSLLEVGTGFHPELTGRENIYLNGSILGMSKWEIDQKFDEIVAFAEVEKFLDTPVKRYSSGMHVRLAFAVAAHLEPEILVVDEVLAVGDGEFQKKCIGKMGQVANHGKTVLLVTHHLGIARNLCQRGIILDRGVLVQDSDIAHSLDFYSKSAAALQSVVTFTHKPNKLPQIIEIAITNGDMPVSRIEYGDRLQLLVKYRCEVPSKSPKLGFVISNSSGERVLNSNMHFLPCPELDRPVRIAQIVCSLGSVPLMAGSYFISLWFGVHGYESEHLPDVISFEVIEKNCWGTGQLPPQGASAMWWPTQFTLVRLQDD